MKKHRLEGELNCENIVYHYTKMTTGLEHIIPDGNLKFGKITTTNDPYEYRSKFIDIKYPEVCDDPENMFLPHEYINKTSVLSLCRNSEILGCLKPRMWSQYGDGNKGFCFAFSKDLLFEEVVKTFKETYYLYSSDVEYTNDLKCEAIDVEQCKHQNDFMRQSLDYVQNNNKQLFFRKHTDYSSENEHRIVVCSDSDSLLIDIHRATKCIIVGDAFMSCYFEQLMYYKNKLNVPLVKIGWFNGAYQLFDFD